MGSARILLADDHKAILETATRLLAADFNVVGAVENGERALEAAASLDPDVVVLDISMPVVNGFEAASRLKKSGSRAKVIFLTALTDQEFVNAAFSAGALGYVLKPRVGADLVPAIQTVLEGRAFASPSLDINGTGVIRTPVGAHDKIPKLVECAEGLPESRMSISRRQLLPPRTWHPTWLTGGAAIVAAAITLLVFYGTQKSHQPASPWATEAQRRQVDELNRKVSARRNNLDRLGELIATQRQEIKTLHAELDKVAKSEEDQRRNSKQMQAEVEQSATRMMQLLADLNNREKALAEAKAELERIGKARVEEQAAFAAQQFRIRELSEQLRLASADLEMERQFVAAGRDVREFMGARQLHVVDVRDTDPSGNPRKAFGRVFLTEGKSLIFYAFDLRDGKLPEAKRSFQLWGEQGDKKASVRSLGLLDVDDKAQKRWALKVENPALLKEIDAVFVTLEPPGGGKQPSGQRLLYAYLGEANPPE